MTNNALIETIEHTDVRGKTLQYIRVFANNKKVVINIRQKNYDELNAILNPKQQELPLEPQKPKK